MDSCQVSHHLILIAFLICFFTHTPPTLAEVPGQIVRLQVENDFIGGGTDRHYTHGTRIQYLTKSVDWIVRAADKLPWFSAAKALGEEESKSLIRAAFTFGQNIFTPEDIGNPNLVRHDRPYAGWLYAGVGLAANQGNNRFDQIELNVGVIGPASGAEWVQKNWHEMFDLRQPEGWDNQLRDEIGVVLYYDQVHRYESGIRISGLEIDCMPHFGGSIGNVYTYASAGVSLRLGPDLQQDFGPPLIRPSLPGTGSFQFEKGLNWYVFGGVGGRFILRNIFLDGNTFEESHSVEKRFWVGDIQVGLTLQMGRFHLAYTRIFRTKEYTNQDRADQFGAISLSYQF